MLLNLIILLNLLSKLCHFTSTEFVPHINCSSVTDSNCECSFLHEFMVGSFRSFVELECVEGNDYYSKRISIKNERNEVSVTCHSVGNENFFHLIPALNINVISSVTLDCPMNVGTTIRNITDRMGINGFDHLTITIDRLFVNLFKDALNITKLDVILAQNAIEFFPTKFLNSLWNLESFVFKSQDGSGTSLIETGIFHSQSKLKSIQMTDVVIKKLNKELFTGATAIINLEFRYSAIEFISEDAFENLPELTTLKFYSTSIAAVLPNSLFSRNLKLENFYSKSNALISGDLLANLTSLKTVDISQCDLSMSANLFNGSYNITMISLTHIYMERISSEIFKDQIELMELDLSYTALLSLPSTIFRTNKKLNKLNLGYNLLKMIPENLFTSTEQLTELNLEFNEIQEISHDILPENLKWLRLNGNKLKTIDERILNRLDDNTGKLKYLFIQTNAFVCECGTNFLRLMREYSDKLNANSVVCQDEDQQFKTMKFFMESCPLSRP